MTEQEEQDQEQNDSSKAEKSTSITSPKNLQEVREAINEQPGPISFEIGTCPKPTFSWFKALAEDQYADNYGLTLTMLKEKLDAYEQMGKRFEHLEKRVERLEEDIDALIEAINEAEDTGNSRDTLNTKEQN